MKLLRKNKLVVEFGIQIIHTSFVAPGGKRYLMDNSGFKKTIVMDKYLFLI